MRGEGEDGGMTTLMRVVDAFTARAFGGNPAAVCLLDGVDAAGVTEGWMQSVAAEMNLSETAFVVRRGEPRFGLRWFTPKVEVDLCGHATLASAHVLWEDGWLGEGVPAVFETQVSGSLICRQVGDGWISMDFPAREVGGAEAPEGLLEALGCDRPGAVVAVGKVNQDYLVHLSDAEAVGGLRPDHGRLAGMPLRAVMVTAAGGGVGVDFVSRFFAPGVGIAEDPVTGSAHCALVPYWARRSGRSELRARQVSARGGDLRLRWRGDRVDIAGQAVTVTRGEWVGR